MNDFKTYMIKRMIITIQIALCFAAGILFVHWTTGGQGIITGEKSEGAQQVQLAPKPGTPTYVLNKHEAECWTGNQTPKAELPGAAIIQFMDGKTVYTNKHKWVDIAFNEALASVGFGDKTSDVIDVIALCK